MAWNISSQSQRSGHYELKASQNTKKLFIKNIDFKARHKDLSQFFEQFGSVASCEILLERSKPRRSRGIGFVTFQSEEAANKALNASEDNLNFYSRVLQLEPAKRKKFIADPAEEVAVTSPAPEDSERESLPHNTTSGNMHLHHLPQELLLHIFRFLPERSVLQGARVCSLWHTLTKKAWYNRSHISLQGVSTVFGGLTDTRFCDLMRTCGPNLQYIDLSGCSRSLSDRSLIAIGQYCPQLLSLSFWSMNCTNKGLQKFAQSCSNLESISLKDCGHVGEDGFWYLFKDCSKLRFIDLESNKRLYGQCFHVLRGGAETLNLNDCPELKDIALSKIAMRCSHNLREIHLNNCYTLTDEGVSDLLEHLFTVSSGCIQTLGTLPNLRELYLKSNTAVDDEVVRAVCEGCQKLRILHLHGCGQNITDLSLESISKLQQLEELDISYLHQIHDSGLHSLSSVLTLKNLIARGCGGITNEGTRAILNSCMQLVNLDICSCLQLNSTILPVKATLDFRSQEDLPLCIVIGGTSITEEDCEHITAKYPFLTLDLSECCPPPDYTDLISSESEDEFEVNGDYEDFLAADDPLANEDFEIS